MKKVFGFLAVVATIALALVFWFSASAYSGGLYSKTIYKNKNWKVIESGIKGEFAVCVVDSSPHYLDKNQNPEYGSTTIRVTQSGKIVFEGERIGAYFKIAKKTMIQVDDGLPLVIVPGLPTDATRIVEAMARGKKVKVSVDFGTGGIDIHPFTLSGFPEAYKKMMSRKKI